MSSAAIAAMSSPHAAAFKLPPGSAYSAEATQFFARLASDPGLTQRAIYAALIDSLVANAVWSGLDVLQVCAADTLPNALVNMPNGTYTSTLLGTPTFTPFRGFTGDGSPSQAIDPHFQPFAANAGSAHFKTNAACIFAWCVTAPGNESVIDTDAATLDIYPSYGGVAYGRVNDNPPTGGFSVASGTGFFFAARTGPNSRTFYRNKVSLGTYGTEPSGSVAVGVPFHAIDTYSGQVACFGVGGNLDAVQDKLYDALRIYMTSVGVP